MARSSAARREAGIEITPLIDVVFLLLLFFMVSTNFVQNKSISVNLPESREGAAVVSKQLEISVNAQGQYSLNGVSVEGNFASLVEMLEQQVQGLPASEAQKLSVLIRADAAAAHQAVVTVLDACASVGLTRVSLGTTGLMAPNAGGGNEINWSSR
ncbi:MAG: biopolymer transporter ExbD [Gammaproteobacteria bacterium]|jgi:biopolymer transport protein ExbD